MSQIHQEVRTFITDQGRDLSAISDRQSLLEAGVLDSVGVLALVAFLEQKYGIKVEDDELMPDNFDTIEAIAAFVARQRGAH